MPAAKRSSPRSWMLACAAACWLVSAGCGTTRDSLATQQLLLSDAVDRSVSTIDFRPLSGRTVFLDNSYLRTVQGTMFVNADYVTSSLRQQIMAAGCLLQESSNNADIIIEARIGTLGADDHRVTFGVPENSGLTSAVGLVANAPTVPQIPEIAIARRDNREGAAKIAAFAYDRESRRAVWQSGMSRSRSTARDTWVLGVGPFQAGSIRDGTRLAGTRLLKSGPKPSASPAPDFQRPPVDYTAETRFNEGWPVLRSDVDSMISIDDFPDMPGYPVTPGTPPAQVAELPDDSPTSQSETTLR